MIRIITDKDIFEYDIRGLVGAFFRGEELTYEAEGSTASGDDAKRLLINWHDKEVTVTFEGESCVRSFDPEIRVSAKSAVKQAIYSCLSEYTGQKLPWGALTGIRPTKLAMADLEKGLDDEKIIFHMQDEYLVSPSKAALALDIAKREKSLLSKLDYENGYSLYIGIPFCPTTCLYCSFTSYPIRAYAMQVDRYLDCLEKELLFTANTFKEKKLNTIYVGGGTPTTLEPAQLDRLCGIIERNFDLSGCLEFTIEAGRPDSITKEKLETIKRHPVDRISINPQTMKQKTLDIIGRHHTVEDTLNTYALAREMGFDNINMDLIMGLPDETIDDAKMTMEKVCELRPDNLTVHSLALKRTSRLNLEHEDYEKYRYENTNAQMELTAEYAASIGLYPYYLYRQKNMAGNLENVGYAAQGKAGLYNILIMEEKQSIVACGAGSISKGVFAGNRIERAENVKNIEQYMDRIDEMIERKRVLFS